MAKKSADSGNLAHAVQMVHAVCCLAGSPSYVDDIRADLRERGIIRAVRDHDTPALFDWLIEALSFQGISDSVAAGYIARNGSVRWADIGAALSQNPSAQSLAGTGCSTIAGTTKDPARVLSPTTSTAVPCPVTRCETAA